MKTLIVLSAPPGCGKSTWARNYIEKHPNTLIISSDELRFEVTGSYTDFSKQPEVWSLFDKRIAEYAKREDADAVILDALNDLDWLRIKYAKEAVGYDHKVLMWMKRPFEETVSNNSKRRVSECEVPAARLKELYDKFEEPGEEAKSYYDEVIHVTTYFNKGQS